MENDFEKASLEFQRFLVSTCNETALTISPIGMAITGFAAGWKAAKLQTTTAVQNEIGK